MQTKRLLLSSLMLLSSTTFATPGKQIEINQFPFTASFSNVILKSDQVPTSFGHIYNVGYGLFSVAVPTHLVISATMSCDNKIPETLPYYVHAPKEDPRLVTMGYSFLDPTTFNSFAVLCTPKAIWFYAGVIPLNPTHAGYDDLYYLAPRNNGLDNKFTVVMDYNKTTNIMQVSSGSNTITTPPLGISDPQHEVLRYAGTGAMTELPLTTLMYGTMWANFRDYIDRNDTHNPCTALEQLNPAVAYTNPANCSNLNFDIINTPPLYLSQVIPGLKAKGQFDNITFTAP